MTATFYAPSESFAKNLNYTMKDGGWLSSASVSDNFLDCVVMKSEGYEVGDEIKLYISTLDEDSKPTLEEISLTARVIGICDYDESAPDFSVNAKDYSSLTFTICFTVKQM